MLVWRQILGTVNLGKYKKRRRPDAFFLCYAISEIASDQLTIYLKLPTQRFMYRALIRNTQ